MLKQQFTKLIIKLHKLKKEITQLSRLNRDNGGLQKKKKNLRKN